MIQFLDLDSRRFHPEYMESCILSIVTSTLAPAKEVVYDTPLAFSSKMSEPAHSAFGIILLSEPSSHRHSWP